LTAALRDFKVPALDQGGLKTTADAETVLFCRAGFTDGLIDAAADQPHVTLVDMDELVAGL
jgi:hypothetical protein